MNDAEVYYKDLPVKIGYQVFKPVGPVEYVRKRDGVAITLYAVSTLCHRCGEPYVFLMPDKARAVTLRKRCGACRLPGYPVRGKPKWWRWFK